MKWRCDHHSCNRNLSNCKQADSNSWSLSLRCSALSIELWRPQPPHAVVFRRLVFHSESPKNNCVGGYEDPDINKLACSQCMGLHSSVGRALQRERRGHRFESRWSPDNLLFRLIRNRLNCDYNCDGHIFISFVFPQFTSFHSSAQAYLKKLSF